jgi:hypothetical protein
MGIHSGKAAGMPLIAPQRETNMILRDELIRTMPSS